MQRALFCSFCLWTFAESFLKMSKEKKSGLSESFITGVIALVFLIVGYQTALMIHNAAVVKITADMGGRTYETRIEGSGVLEYQR